MNRKSFIYVILISILHELNYHKEFNLTSEPTDKVRMVNKTENGTVK